MDRLLALVVRARLARDLITDRRGVTALEYGLIASLIAAAIITAVSSLGTNMSTTFSSIATKI